MSRDEIIHYTSGGWFKGIYQPAKVDDLHESLLDLIGKEMYFFQNVDISPIQQATYFGEFRFSTNDIPYWVPESDIKDLTMMQDNNGLGRPLIKPKDSCYVYRLSYTTKSQIVRNFGAQYRKTLLPFYLYRSYDLRTDDRIFALSHPQATRIEVAFWDPLHKPSIYLDYELLYEDKNASEVLPETPKYITEKIKKTDKDGQPT